MKAKIILRFGSIGFSISTLSSVLESQGMPVDARGNPRFKAFMHEVSKAAVAEWRAANPPPYDRVQDDRVKEKALDCEVWLQWTRPPRPPRPNPSPPRLVPTD
jgi:hypothetical protein